MVEYLQSGDQTMVPEDSAWQAMPHFWEIGCICSKYHWKNYKETYYENILVCFFFLNKQIMIFFAKKVGKKQNLVFSPKITRVKIKMRSMLI